MRASVVTMAVNPLSADLMHPNRIGVVATGLMVTGMRNSDPGSRAGFRHGRREDACELGD